MTTTQPTPTVNTVSDFLARFAPLELAEDWDNVGLLVGDGEARVERLMTCLTITPPVVEEAVRRRADLIVAHHPLPFRALKRLTRETTAGRMLLDLIAAGIAVYSPHTGFDSAAEGINQRLALGLGLCDIGPLVPIEGASDTGVIGAGRRGRLDEPVSLAQFAQRVKDFLAIENLQLVGEDNQSIASVAVACGAAGEFLRAAQAAGCDCMLLGETNFHTCLEAQATGVALVLPGHYASERFAVESLAGVLAEQFSMPEGGGMEIWPATAECDPIRWM